MRKFVDRRVLRIPNKQEILAIHENYPDSNVEVFAEQGKKLSEDMNDMGSYRYASVNLGANSRKELFNKYAKIETNLEKKFIFKEPTSFSEKLFKIFSIGKK